MAAGAISALGKANRPMLFELGQYFDWALVGLLAALCTHTPYGGTP